ncbi:MAG: sterol desaturase family protein [Polyangiaceae bacterium]|nr:sterol desaturase family protein [Polyangiaceae bacterium]
MLELYAIVAAILAFDGLLLVGLVWAFHAPRFRSRRIEPDWVMKVPRGARIRNVVTSSLLSLVTVLGVIYVLYERLFSVGPTPLWQSALRVVGVFLVYDFAYYFLHRGMHHKKLMRFVHGVHHRARNPSALESFYLHPIELLAGLALLFGATWVVGPLHIHAFAVVFFVYTTLNILVHAGLRFRHWLLAPIDFLTRKHHVHHFDDFGKNYASLTPLPDLLFRSASR